MKVFLQYALIVASMSLFFGPALLTFSFSPPAHSVEYNNKATVLLGTIGAVGQVFGTGFFINNQYIVTAAHVVNKMPVVRVKTYFKQEIVGEVIALDKDRDLAIVRLPHPIDIKSMNIACSYTARGGDQIYATGMGRAFMWSTRFGQIMRDMTVDSPAVIDDNEPMFDKVIAHSFLMEIQAIPGMSGSAIQNSRGNVIGVMSIGGLEASEIGFAIKAKHLCEFLETNSISYN